MIRRGFWLVAGAALGISGYRRAGRLLRGTGIGTGIGTGSALAVPGAQPPLRPGRALLAAAASAGRGTVHGLAFARDVADGMAEYLDRESPAPGRTLGRQPRHANQGRSRPGHPGAP